MSKPKILIVDDEQRVLDSFKDLLRKHYELYTALSAAEGLQTLADKGPVAVVVSDMIMPGMDGAEFLAKVKDQFPDSIRILLTGQANAESASRAVNEGGVYKFITKPCNSEEFLSVLGDACALYQQQHVEQDLLQTTLFASMEVMSEVLSIVNPVAFSRGGRLRSIIQTMAKADNIADAWQYEIAAMLSQLGCVTLPPDLLEKVYTRSKLTAEEHKSYKNHPEVAYQLLNRIPRMEQVALMIRNQNHPESPKVASPDEKGDQTAEMSEQATLGARLLFVAGLYEDLRMAGAGHKQAMEKLHNHFKGKYANYIDALAKAGRVLGSELIPKTIELSELVPGMILREDILSKTNMLLMTKGQSITTPAIGRLMGFHERIGVRQPFKVLVRSNKS